ncbi:hypothetical protein PVAND_017836, partial [Polypedilum vanderplanki]
FCQKPLGFHTNRINGSSLNATPKYCIDGFYIDNDKLEIIEHIRKIVEVLAPNSAEKVDDEFAKFINMISNLSQNKKEIDISNGPKAYWNAFGKTAAERVWSSFGFIHTKLRNRLRQNRVDKLISIYVNNALISKLDNFERYLLMILLFMMKITFEIFNKLLFIKYYCFLIKQIPCNTINFIKKKE